MKNNYDMAILVVSCDAYADVAKYFFPLLKRYWPDCNYNIYFINNTLNEDYENVTVINGGLNMDWSGRVKSALNNIKEKYVLFMLEDYYIGEPVDSSEIMQAINIMESEKLLYYKITNKPKGTKKYKNYNFLSTIPDNQPYGINLQAAIWKKDFFLNILGEIDCSAWKVEINQLKNVKSKYSKDIEGCVVDTRNIIDIHNGVIKGKWVPKTLHYFRKRDFYIDTGKREKLSMIDRFSITIRGNCKSLFSNHTRKLLKKYLSKIGFKFTSEY